MDVYPASLIPKNLHNLVKPVNQLTSRGSRLNIREKGFRIVTEPSTVSSVLQWTPDDEVTLHRNVLPCLVLELSVLYITIHEM